MNPSNEIGAVLTAWAKYFLESFDPNNSKLGGDWSDARNSGRSGANSVMDSEILLPFLLADSQLKEFKFECLSQGGLDELEKHPLYGWLYEANKKSRTFGYWNDRIKAALKTYFLRNQDENGVPTFATDTYIEITSPDNLSLRGIETIDGYSLSLSTSLYISLLSERLKLSFINDDEKEEKFWTELGELASKRITAAMVGLINSFAVSTLSEEDWEAKTGRKWPERKVNSASKNKLGRIRAELLALGYSVPSRSTFELGWAWGPVKEVMHFTGSISALRNAEQFDVYAKNAPYLYFTISALDGISDLSAIEIESSNILNAEQLTLAAQLKSLFSMTSTYWNAVATADQTTNGPGIWEIETLPWRTADGQGSLYWNLYLSRIILASGNLSESELARLISLAERLGEAARITTPPFPEETDQAVAAIHFPGLEIDLEIDDSFDGGKVSLDWKSYDFSAQLLKMSAHISLLSHDLATTQRSLSLTGRVWDHLDKRRCLITDGRGWDVFEKAFPFYEFFNRRSENLSNEEIQEKRKLVGLPEKNNQINSWYMTERVVEALVIVALAERQKPQPSKELQRMAISIAQELQWLVSISKNDDDINELRQSLDIARELIADRPAFALGKLIALIEKYG